MNETIIEFSGYGPGNIIVFNTENGSYYSVKNSMSPNDFDYVGQSHAACICNNNYYVILFDENGHIVPIIITIDIINGNGYNIYFTQTSYYQFSCIPNIKTNSIYGLTEYNVEYNNTFIGAPQINIITFDQRNGTNVTEKIYYKFDIDIFHDELFYGYLRLDSINNVVYASSVLKDDQFHEFYVLYLDTLLLDGPYLYPMEYYDFYPIFYAFDIYNKLHVYSIMNNYKNDSLWIWTDLYLNKTDYTLDFVSVENLSHKNWEPMIFSQPIYCGNNIGFAISSDTMNGLQLIEFNTSNGNSTKSYPLDLLIPNFGFINYPAC